MQNAEILAVDDTPANLRILTRLLRGRGFSVRAVSSGELALEAVASRPPDLILLDINMPGMDGYEVCRRLKADPAVRDIPVIFVSALDQSSDKLRAFEEGGVDFINKPYSAAEVEARINTHLSIRRMQREFEEQNHQLRESNRRLLELEASREALIHMLVHDMRSPLTGIVSSLHLLRMDAEDSMSEENREDIDAAIANSKRVTQMINDLLDVSRMESGEMPMAPSESSVASIVDGAVAMLAGHAYDRRIEVDLAADLGNTVCDSRVIERVLCNLLHNGLRRSRAGGSVRLEGRRASTGIRVAVHDDGQAVDARSAAGIFEKHGDLEARRAGVTSATGLGLAFCSLAVRAHGGAIGVESVSEGLNVFWFTLPERAGENSSGE